MKLTAYRIIVSGVSLITAAVVLVGGIAVAFGQERVIAKVPFSFRAGESAMEAGNYELAPYSPSSHAALTLRNIDTRKTVAVLVQSPIYGAGRGADTHPRLIFRCASAGCTISQVWTGIDGWQLSAPTWTAAEKERIAVVYFRNKADD